MLPVPQSLHSTVHTYLVLVLVRTTNKVLYALIANNVTGSVHSSAVTTVYAQMENTHAQRGAIFQFGGDDGNL